MNTSGSLIPNVIISGNLNSVYTHLFGTLSSIGRISGQIKIPEQIGADVYEGDYIVDPKFSEQILQTKNKIMRDDVTVNEIAVSAVQNPQGGNTIWIGVI